MSTIIYIRREFDSLTKSLTQQDNALHLSILQLVDNKMIISHAKQTSTCKHVYMHLMLYTWLTCGMFKNEESSPKCKSPSIATMSPISLCIDASRKKACTAMKKPDQNKDHQKMLVSIHMSANINSTPMINVAVFCRMATAVSRYR
jgi:hypothetical protein